jgi:hypothetical protein
MSAGQSPRRPRNRGRADRRRLRALFDAGEKLEALGLLQQPAQLARLLARVAAEGGASTPCDPSLEAPWGKPPSGPSLSRPATALARRWFSTDTPSHTLGRIAPHPSRRVSPSAFHRRNRSRMRWGRFVRIWKV